MQINVLDARNRLSQVIKAAQAGEDVVIANRGRALVRLVPVASQPAAAEPGRVEGVLGWLAGHPLPEAGRRRAAEIDAAVQAGRDAWD
ncbi:type II toxin-antitoxin system Phd/YefM family antitoxin [Xylophilus sp.]|uniref:type II toxin-antitoxin system Phd/YefM family antitoxin n=1 Tax=Xylophilus sp. TaxID=2653893 RepID=UPI0013BE45C3|nr:type II toxin-antitoxin system prevent-host-death family antitoxin [Xylophilus sp.]KAF1047074.1 MAG: hypothetical protein GAK38_02119 [Xylophilus sp.]